MSKKKSKVNIPGIILIISAMFLGVLIVILVAGNKKKITIDGSISSLGTHIVKIELHPKVIVDLKIRLVK